MNGIFDNPEKGSELLLEILQSSAGCKIEIDSHNIRLETLDSVDWVKVDLRDKLKDWIEKGRELTNEFKPDSYSVTLNVPFSVSIGFSWNTEKE